MADVETLATEAIDCGLRLHKRIGPGLFESVYETLLAEGLSRRGLRVERQKLLSVEIDGIFLADAFRVDLLVESSLLIELNRWNGLRPFISNKCSPTCA